MKRDESSTGAEVVRLNVPHALRDERLARMLSRDLLPYASHVVARLGPDLGKRGAALWREAVLAPAYLSPAAPLYRNFAREAPSFKSGMESAGGRAALFPFPSCSNVVM